ncbi:hypothetical protein [Paraburkholderia sediminicola]|uniref:hypothetical protein n=1 Tax=Paraburkholderia sediminicola TaxID=458836 RepID=UPI000F261F42
MRLIIEARLEGGETSGTEATPVAVVERKDRSVADLGLTLAEGRALLAEVRSLLVSEQTAGWLESQLACHRCGSMLAHKDAQSIVLRTVFGKVDVPSPRLRACSCAAKQGQPRRSVSPLCKAVHQRVTPELEYLQAKWAAHLPYRLILEPVCDTWEKAVEDLLENYRAAGFSKNIGFGNNPALILVDFVGAYFLEHSSLYSRSSYRPLRVPGSDILQHAAHRRCLQSPAMSAILGMRNLAVATTAAPFGCDFMKSPAYNRPPTITSGNADVSNSNTRFIARSHEIFAHQFPMPSTFPFPYPRRRLLTEAREDDPATQFPVPIASHMERQLSDPQGQPFVRYQGDRFWSVFLPSYSPRLCPDKQVSARRNISFRSQSTNARLCDVSLSQDRDLLFASRRRP